MTLPRRARTLHGPGRGCRARGASRLLLGAALALLGRAAYGENGLESPGAGAIPTGRGGAWLVRADDPIAVYYNPAALVTQSHGVSLGANLLFASRCFDRTDASGQRPSPGQSLAAAPDEVCADVTPLPTPQLAASLRLHKHFALGLGLLTPHASGSVSWPVTLAYADRYGETDHPSPTRYLLVDSDNVLLNPTLSASVAVSRELSLGVGFVWGLAWLDFSSMAEAISPARDPSQPDEFAHDMLAEVSGFDGFVPGLVASVLWSPTERVGLAGWFRWSDAVRTAVDLRTTASYYTLGGRVNEGAIDDPANITELAEAGTLRMPIPMEAKLGFRYRHPRARALPRQFALEHDGWVRDPMSTDLFDIELDLTWSNNSAVDSIELRFLPGIQIAPTTGVVPENADIPHGWKDALGVRLGGDYVVLPDLLALRLGGFFESSSANAPSVHLDFHPSEKVGIGAGGTVRLSWFDVSLAYQHTFFGAIDNGGEGRTRAISGDRTSGQRSRQFVNGGRATASLDELALGAAVHF